MFDSMAFFFPDIRDMPLFPVHPLPADLWKDGLLVRSPNWLGDAVMTFPALKQLKALLPENCGLMVQCPKGLEPLFQALSCVDQVYPVKNPHAFPDRRELHGLKCCHAGAGVLFNNSFRDALSLKLAGIPYLYGASARFRSWLLRWAYSFPARHDRVLNHPHQALKYLAMATAIGAPPWDGIMPDLHPKPLRLARSLVQDRCEDPAPLLIVAGGAAYGDAKRWDPVCFREVARRWISEQNGIVVAVGSKNEAPAAMEILSGLPPARAFMFAGQTNLDELMLLLQHAALCVANDSGVMHLAAAAGTPGVALFGSTDPAATSPLSRNWTVLYEKQSCSPCFRRVCPNGTKACFVPLTAEKVMEAAKKTLG